MSDADDRCQICRQYLDAEPPIDRPICYTCANNELDRVKAAVQLHHDQRGDNRCADDDLKLYHDVLGINPDPYVTAQPPEADMAESCARYRRQRQCPEVAGTYPMPFDMTIQQLSDCLSRFIDMHVIRTIGFKEDGQWVCTFDGTLYQTREETIQAVFKIVMEKR